MVELQHEPHDAEHVCITAYRGCVYGQTALHAFCQEVTEVGESRCETRRGERSDAHMGLRVRDHLALFRGSVVGVNELHVSAQQLLAIEDLDAAKLRNLRDGAAGVLRDG